MGWIHTPTAGTVAVAVMGWIHTLAAWTVAVAVVEVMGWIHIPTAGTVAVAVMDVHFAALTNCTVIHGRRRGIKQCTSYAISLR